MPERPGRASPRGGGSSVREDTGGGYETCVERWERIRSGCGNRLVKKHRGPFRDQTGGEALQGSSAVADEPCRPFRAARVRYVVTTAAVVGSAYLEMSGAAAELRAQLM